MNTPFPIRLLDGPTRLLDGLSSLAGRASGYVSVAMTLIMLAVLVAQVAARYFFNIALSWSEELSLLLFTWVVLLIGSLGVREGFHVRLTLLPDLLKPAQQRWLERLILLGILGFGVMLALGGYTYVIETVGQTSAAIAYPIEVLHLAAPVCGALVALHALAKLATSFLPDPAIPSEAG
ncbi:TRAP transporter small permease [Oceanibaculum nanhaiense]|jgi:TRAP-type C4-dicarboxylate transport system permease small subunit|uniref:TRAP transporter small permease n=1 Tax=Oceanibaculum nanhaiense TaxID=1909734 RepID=UPI000A366C0E|nr:TRAP transporter small permease [Oceanibaculum nanhaiense]MBC7135943.1 TRAP transporter small permease [Oceanibaculum nanhaiense]